MGKLSYKTICVMAACLLLSLFNSSCQDDLLTSEATRVEEGLPTTLKLNINVGDMDVQTRSIAEDSTAHYCNNLWIGIYDSSTGEQLDSYYTTDVSSTEEKPNTNYALTFNTKSANSVYIVGVANSDVNSGILGIDNYGGEEKTLRQILDQADTFEKFQNICALRPDPCDVNVYVNTLTMSGYYRAANATTMEPVTIAPGSADLTGGAIYLQRIIAFNRFNIFAGENVNLSVSTWKVCNIPAGCSLFEGTGNIADNMKDASSFYNESNETRNFTLVTDETTGKTGKSFEFYQVENKHTAVAFGGEGSDHVGIDPSAANLYDEREREFKTDNGLNTGLYRSLLKSTDGDKYNGGDPYANNYASYVVLKADIDYYVAPPEDGKDFNPETAIPVDPSTPNAIHRTAQVVYTIHLGYCEDKEGGKPTVKTAQDFNCRRNTRYTYNVTINGVKNIVVEAVKRDGTEDQPGAEGWVADEIGKYQALDSHFCEFNISLTDAERKALFYRVTAPYANQYYYCNRDADGNVTTTDGMNKALYSWIKFYPTVNEGTLAEYVKKGDVEYGINSVDKTANLDYGGELWTLDDLVTKDNDVYDADDDGNKWYTVFVDEYVYHFDDQGNKETSWPYYANQDNRIVELILQNSKSLDTESTYSYCKYVFGQKSIQTYYKGSRVGDRAIGVEHIEETYCLNTNWSFQSSGWGTERNYSSGGQQFYDFTNGRYNQWKYLQNKNITKWSEVIQPTVPGHVKGYESTQWGCSHPDADYPVYMPKPFNTNGGNRPENSPSLNDNNTYYANSICMNRNRDLNGNGVIDDDEIRWYLPTSSDYIQIAICQEELPDPIMRFTDYDPDYFIPIWASYPGSDNQEAGRYGTYNYHYITSDYQYYFAEQLAATGDNPYAGWAPKVSSAYTARCIRNLGTDLGTPAYGVNEVDNAFSYDENTRIFDQFDFRDEQLRGYTLGGLAPHSSASLSSHPYKKFQVAKNIFSSVSDDYVKFSPNIDYEVSISPNTGSEAAGTLNDLLDKTTAWANSLKKNGLCSQYTEEEDDADIGTWRVPSIGELGLMWIEGLAQKDGYSYLSATYDYFTSYKMRNLTGNNHLYLGYFDNNNDRHIISLDVLDRNNIRLRCVRDVK
jgi:hypothetical protein